ncbi:HugZ family protein [Mariprofundus ferrooxydans]|uniref:HugZ family pyridoxamine 5'-phosphate oxidase n=1 Tax=Mariprofundus ferrooxydans TaxID=314344 RepID=UPI000378DBB3|nr:pyridoxamine 5'-phosphate oxidase family protein [Mariprofundus ferrooxydans]
MSDSWQQGVGELLQKSRISFLATEGRGGPETSMAPYALHRGLILLHLSGLARHTANIEQHPQIGLMICTAESESHSPLALARLSLQGDVRRVPDEQLATARSAYLKHIPEAEQLFSFADFHLFEFTPAVINWVGGFGKARKISQQQWQQLSDGVTLPDV